MTVLGAATASGGHVSASEAMPDTLSLGEVQVRASATARPRISSDASVAFGKEALSAAPRAFGEADALRFMRMLPGVSAASDYASGLSVDGMDYSQTLYRLNGIPVHFPYHFGGIFSTFPQAMYPSVRLSKSINDARENGTLGGVVNLRSADSHPGRVSADVNVGMIASSAWVSVPVGDRLSVSASARASYIDALYAPLLRSGVTQTSYNLADADFSAVYDITGRDCLQATFHYNADNVAYTDGSYSLTTALEWHNLLAGLEWRRSGDRTDMSHQVYYTRFHNMLRLDMEQIELRAPTGIDEGGVRGSVDFTGLPAGWELTAGYNARLYSVRAQSVELEGMGQDFHEPRAPSNSLEAAVTADAARALPHGWKLRAGLALNLFSAEGGYTCFHPDLRLSVSRMWRRGSLTLHAGRYHQYLHQVGFSDLGMSSNFKIAASREIPPQQSYTLAVAGAWHATGWLSLNADVYYKRVGNQAEYLGAILDILDSGYRAENYILSCDGHNAGVNLSGRLETGRVTAMASYGYCHTRRRMPGEPLPFSASNELRHTAGVSAAWTPGEHWMLSAGFNLASGHPYTPVKAIYFIGNKLMMEYGHRNSARLPLYHRLDLGASYRFSTGGSFPLRHEVNLSVINAYGHRNVEMTSFSVNTQTGLYGRRNVSSLYRFLPSLSYSISF